MEKKKHCFTTEELEKMFKFYSASEMRFNLPCSTDVQKHWQAKQNIFSRELRVSTRVRDGKIYLYLREDMNAGYVSRDMEIELEALFNLSLDALKALANIQRVMYEPK